MRCLMLGTWNPKGNTIFAFSISSKLDGALGNVVLTKPW